jgi:uncharacterized protein involved in exopolysaccharide biosynthesis/Mrp family chromosome partitioning ATPase
MVARRLWKDKYIFVAATLICGVIAAIMVSRVTPQYTSMSQVLLDPSEQRLVISQQVVSDRQLNDQVMGSELSILRSNTLLKSVIQAVDAKSPAALLAIDSAARTPSLLSRAKSSIKRLLSSSSAPAMSAAAIEAARLDRLTWAIRRSMDTWRDGDSYVISISVQTPAPELSMLLATTIAEQYVAQQLESLRMSSAQAAEWIELRVDDLRHDVTAAEGAVEDYRARSLESTGTSFDIISQRLVSLNEELIKARVEKVTAESRFNEIRRLIDEEGFEAIAGMFTSEPIIALNAQRLQLEAEDSQWAQRFDTSHPERRKIADKLLALKQALVAETQLVLDAQRNEVEIARLREQTMDESLKAAEQQFLAISRSAVGLRQLEREAVVARNMYTDLLNRYTETRTKEQLLQANARIIENATFPGAPSSPRPKLMIMLGLMIGAAIGASIVLVRTLTKGTYTSISELEHDVNLPVLTALPERGWTSLREALRDVSSDRFGETAEGIRRLRNELAITDQDAEIQSIALLSPLQDEGKTMTTVLLAHMTAQSDRLVVVVDCDFRRNTIQAEFNFEMPYDFGDVLLGDCSVVEALHTETRLGFDLLAVRNRQPEAVEMLTSETLQDIIAELKRYYDVVFVNCPAVLPAAESLAIARAVDQRVLLARYDSTPRKAMQRCLTVLENNRLDVTGQVLTRVDPNMLHDNAVYAYDTSS